MTNECDPPLVISASFLKLWNPSPPGIFRDFHEFSGHLPLLSDCLPGRIATAGGPKCRHFSARHCSMPPAWTPCRAKQQHRILFGQQCCSGSTLCHTKAPRQQKIEFQTFCLFPLYIFVENEHAFPKSSEFELVNSLFF